jgi:hypothetical protein
VVAACLGWELAASLDEVPELRLAALEFPGFVIRGDPICDFAGLVVVSFRPSFQLMREGLPFLWDWLRRMVFLLRVKVG